MHPFRFAVQAEGAPSAAQWRDLARRVEDLGYSTLYVPDHFGHQWGPLVTLTVASEATTTLRVGALVFDNDFRHPMVLAKELATLDLVSEGRLEVGLGAGWMRTDYEQSGISYDPAGSRVERLTESLAIMKRLWSDGEATMAGRHYKVAAAKGGPSPQTRPHPPIVIGGGSPRILSLAATQADIVGFNASLGAGEIGPEVAASATAERFTERVSWVRDAAGERFRDLELQCLAFFVQVGPGGPQLLESMAPAFGISPEEAAKSPLLLVGTVEELAEELVRRREEFGFSYWVVRGDHVNAFAPLVDRLAGS